MEMQKYGSWAFIIGVVLAIIGGILGVAVFGPAASWIPLIFLVLGIVIGLLNVKDKETTTFLVATIALLVTAGVNWASIPTIGAWIGAIVLNIAVLMAPAAVIVALKAVWNLAQN